MLILNLIITYITLSGIGLQIYWAYKLFKLLKTKVRELKVMKGNKYFGMR